MRNTLIKLVTLFTLLASSAQAGEMNTKKDDFDGSTSKYYSPTTDESLKSGLSYVMFSYDKATAQVSILMGPFNKDHIVDCHRPVKIKGKDGSINDIQGIEDNLQACVLRVPASLLKDEFTVRFPVYREADMDGHFDTKNLNPEILGTVK